MGAYDDALDRGPSPHEWANWKALPAWRRLRHRLRGVTPQRPLDPVVREMSNLAAKITDQRSQIERVMAERAAERQIDRALADRDSVEHLRAWGRSGAVRTAVHASALGIKIESNAGYTMTANGAVRPFAPGGVIHAEGAEMRRRFAENRPSCVIEYERR